ncbi:MAG: hypothetical protein WA463_04610 [Terriglobales bacterium]
MRWSGISPTVDLYNVVVYGAAPYSTPPLLEVDHIGMGMRIVSLLRGTWYLNDVRIDHPVVRVLVDARGRDNLPQTKRSSQSHTSVFDLAVRHVRLDRGEVYYSEFLVGKDARSIAQTPCGPSSSRIVAAPAAAYQPPFSA